nr:SDR family oxidoreductase [Bacteroidota bacterium]
MEPFENLLSLTNKVVLVTGGAVNIGRGIAKKLAIAGAKLAVIYNSSSNEAEGLKEWFTKNHIENLAIRADLRQETEIVQAVKKVIEHFGQVDVLVNNSGVFVLSLQHELSTSDWEAVFDLNMRGLFITTREVLKSMIKVRSGVIVNIASINGMHPGFGKTAHYDATKGGLIAYTRSLAAETGHDNIRVNAVAPGLVDSENLRHYANDLAESVEKRTPLKKIASADDVANAVLFLASGAASHITGEVLVVDGGYLLT